MDPQAAHPIAQRELVQHGFARVSLVREARGLDVRDQELDGRVNRGLGLLAARLEEEAPC